MCRQRNIGASGVLTADGPRRLPMPNEPDLLERTEARITHSSSAGSSLNGWEIDRKSGQLDGSTTSRFN
jgi:hypothetical protein